MDESKAIVALLQYNMLFSSNRTLHSDIFDYSGTKQTFLNIMN